MPKNKPGRPRTGRIKLGITIRHDRAKYLRRLKRDGRRIGHVVDEALDLHEKNEKEGLTWQG